MSRNTPSFAIERVRRPLRLAAASMLAVAIALSGPVAAVGVPPLPSAILELASDLKLQGGGELRFFGIPIYDGWYWSTKPGWSADQVFALDLIYLRSLDGARIAERSVEEIAKLGHGNAELRARWGAQMKRIFPDVNSGDRLTGVNLPGGKVRYFFNGQPIGEIVDPEFARAFFAIWFDPKSSRADFRQKLLGQK
jgi:hypothetical protein